MSASTTTSFFFFGAGLGEQHPHNYRIDVCCVRPREREVREEAEASALRSPRLDLDVRRPQPHEFIESHKPPLNLLMDFGPDFGFPSRPARRRRQGVPGPRYDILPGTIVNSLRSLVAPEFRAYDRVKQCLRERVNLPRLAKQCPLLQCFHVHPACVVRRGNGDVSGRPTLVRFVEESVQWRHEQIQIDSLRLAACARHVGCRQSRFLSSPANRIPARARREIVRRQVAPDVNDHALPRSSWQLRVANTHDPGLSINFIVRRPPCHQLPISYPPCGRLQRLP